MIQQQTYDFNASLIGLAFLLYVTLLFVKKRRKWRRFNYLGTGKKRTHLRLLKKNSFSSNDKSNFVSRKLLNNSEKHFFRILSEALPDYYVFPQVSFNALITHSSWIKHLHWERFVRRKFNTKYVDFVLCRKSDFEVVAIVEYDGSGHKGHDDEQRDQLLVYTGYRIERFTDGVTIDFVKTRFDDLLTIHTRPQ